MGKGHHHHHDHDHDHHHDHHDHHHDHDHGHHHVDPTKKAFLIGIALNLGFTIIEFAYGFISNSVALMADAGHNLSDVLGLVIAYIASRLVIKKASSRFTFGLKGSTIISALFNASLLFVAIGMILVEAIHRINSQAVIQTNTMMIVAGIGIVINFATAMMFHTHAHDDLNAKGAYLHLLGDAAVSLGVVIAGFIISKTGLVIIDPILSIAISIFIGYGTWNLFKEALYLSINAAPEKIDIDHMVKDLTALPNVKSIHDLHVWAMSTTENAMTVHLVLNEENHQEELLAKVNKLLHEKFKISHVTVQMEFHQICDTSVKCN